MHRMIQRKTIYLLVATVALAWTVTFTGRSSVAAPPAVVQAHLDYNASGYVTPAGMAPPSMYGNPMTAGYPVMPVGYYAGCDSCGSCDGGCDSGCNSCDSGCGGGGILQGGVLGKMMNGCGGCGLAGCNSCAGMCCTRLMCLFCQGSGCSACQMFGPQAIAGALQMLRPYQEAGRCAQRWYDLSAEAVWLSHSDGSLRGDLTSLGTAPSGPIVLRRGDANGGDKLEEGVRLSASMIFGAGANLEATYLGGNEWSSQAQAVDGTANLFSFISDFGTNPINGFDDTDRSLVQAVVSTSEFHSGEMNYRRRTVGPYCRFQGSWLVGLRYVRFQNGYQYAALGENNNTVNASLPRFFSSLDDIKNDLFGPQAGFDLWWNMVPGINFGIGVKGAWVQNTIKRRVTMTANSLVAGGPGVISVSDTDRDTTVMGEFEAKLIYRISHSIALRSAYYAIAVDDVAFGTVDRDTIRDFINSSPVNDPALTLHSLVVQGFSFGAEYTW